MFRRHTRYDMILWLLFCLLCALLILSARAHPLWGDEAETALFARNILSYGLPKGWDGVNIMGINNAVVLDKHLINHTSPWAQYYLTAFSFFLFGESSFTARIPSIILSLFSAMFLAIYALRHYGRTTSLIAVLFLSLSPAYILFSYQARYYSLTTCAALLMTLSSMSLLTSRRANIMFFLSGILFFYGNYVSFLAWYISLFITSMGYHISTASWTQTKKYVVRFFFLSVLIIGVTAPWYLMVRPFDTRGSLVLPGIWDALIYLGMLWWEALNPYNRNNTLPLVSIIGAVIWMIWKKRQGSPLSPLLFPLGISSLYLLVMALFTLIAQVDTSFVHTRYTMVVIPFFLLVSSILCTDMIIWNKYIGYVLCCVYISSNLFTITAPQSLFANFLSEVWNPYQTPDIAVAGYLQRHAKDNDTAWVNLDRNHEPLIFHLGKKIRFVNRVSLINTRIFPENRGTIPRYIYDFRDHPDWIILYSKRGNDGTFFTFDHRPLPPDIHLDTAYQEIVLPIFFSDMSRPEIELRSFTAITPSADDQVFIYKKR